MKKVRNSVPIAREFFKTPAEISLKEIIMHNFAKREINDQSLINEFCEMHYGTSWDVIIEFEGYCFDQPEKKIPFWVNEFIEKKYSSK